MAQDVALWGVAYTDVPEVRVPKQGGGMAAFHDVSDTTAAAADVAQGKLFHAADGTLTEGTASGGGGVTVEALSVTTNGTYTAETGHAYSPVTVNVSGGGGGLTLLATQSLGTVNTSSTTARDLGISVAVSGIDGYELLVVENSTNTTPSASRHMATVSLIYLTATDAISEKTSYTIATAVYNMRKLSTGEVQAQTSTTKYGVYANSVTIDSGAATIPIYCRYNSGVTGTISSNYTSRVYGVKLYDMIGG